MVKAYVCESENACMDNLRVEADEEEDVAVAYPKEHHMNILFAGALGFIRIDEQHLERHEAFTSNNKEVSSAYQVEQESGAFCPVF